MKSNAEIVIRYLQTFEEEIIQFPDGYKYGWCEDKLCMVLAFHDWIDGEFVATGKEEWRVADVSFNYFIGQCNLLTETDIMGMVFSLGMKKENSRGTRNTNISG